MHKEGVFEIWMCAALLLACQSSVASEPYQDYQKRIESAQRLTALKSDLFGDNINLYNGQTSISNVDIDLTGNNNLPVRLERRFSVDLSYTGEVANFNASLEGAGGWTVEVPYITGMFQTSSGWSPQRCSVDMVPTINTAFRLTEVWQGNTVHIPGGSDRALLRLESTTPRPNDGVARLWTTRERDAVDCIPMQSGLAGEGFRVTTTSGVRYYFDVATSRFAGVLNKTLGEVSRVHISRNRIYLLASKVEDRFGNTVQYQYNANGNPVRIWSSDGREITLTYNGQHLSAAATSGRVWSYDYGSVEGQTRLTSVTLPDNSHWNYVYSNALSAQFPPWDGNSTSDCSEQPPEVVATFNLTITHPSGAIGGFSFANRRHYRSGIHMSECLRRVNNGTFYYELDTPNFFDVMSLNEKTISGTGLTAPLRWVYAYGGGYQKLWGSRDSSAIYPCTMCTVEKEVQITNPDNSKIKYRYGFLYALNEGRLLGSSVLNASNSVVSSSSSIYMTTAEVASQPFAPRYGLIFHGDDPSTAQVRPIVNTVTNQDGVAFQASNQSFDSFARPLQVTRSSPSGGRTDVTTYHDNIARWILAQVAKTTNTNTGLVETQTAYDPITTLPTATYAFGKLQSSMAYYADGTLNTIKDGRNNTTTFTNWKRGIPQAITYADGSAQSAVVNDAGWITSVTDENGYATGYSYDAMGRLTKTTYPTGDSPAWEATTRSFVPVSSVEYGIPAGHWRETVSTGNAVKVTYFDALWRPLLVRQYDAANVAGTERFTRTAYDTEGRVGFQSYPSNTSSPSTGVWTLYDALGRVTSVSQDSELGLLTTTTAYNAGFTTTVTNPRGKAVTTAYMSYDQPSTDWPVSISAPEGQTTTITRDPFGKPLTLARSGSALQTRYYAYNSAQELCKSWEPETRGAIYAYDAAGNLLQSASGLNTVTRDSSACNADQFSAGRTASRTYDARNRLKTLAFPDGNGNQSWAYTADGLPSTVTTSNNGNSVTNTYAYNKRRLLTSEGMTADAQASWSVGYGYNALAQVISEAAPASVAVNYTVNALGQTTAITARPDAGTTTTLASNASYYPNGALKQFTYGNGIVHTMTQNARQLPRQSSDGSVLNLTTTFDANGNVTAITDNTPSARQTRSMAYDGLDRLTSTTSPMFGNASYTYDTLDNLTRVSLSGGNLPRNHYYCYNSDNNRLLFVRSGPQCTGNASPAVTALTYDVQGNLASKNGSLYTFDYGNRLRSTAGLSYRYDADGRRVRQDSAGASLKYSYYAKDGRLLWQRDEPNSKRINNVYLAGSLLAEITRPIGNTTPTISYFHTDALGSPIAKTNATGVIVETSEYEPYGRLLNRNNDDRAGYTGHVMDAASGLTYMQQRYYDPAIGRFLSVDPVTADTVTGWNFNRYNYAANNPYKFTDPDGRATVYRYADKIVVVQTYKNNGTQFTDDQIQAQGASLSGQTSDGKTVVVQFVPGNDKDTVHLNVNPNLDDTSLDGTKRSHADKIGGRVVEIAPNAAGEGTIGHELGHTLHAGDQYKDGIGADGKQLQSDVAGPANIMKTATGTANTQTVDEIYKGASSKDNTQVNCTQGAKAGC